MTPRLCKYECGTMLEGFDETERKYLEAGTGGLHTKERCQEAKSRRPFRPALVEEKNDHGNELNPFKPNDDVQLQPLGIGGLKEKTEFVDHTTVGIAQIKTFTAPSNEILDKAANEWLLSRGNTIRFRGGQFQYGPEGFAIALYYEETKT